MPSEISGSLIPFNSDGNHRDVGNTNNRLDMGETSKLGDSVSLVISTASLPLKSKPSQPMPSKGTTNIAVRGSDNPESSAKHEEAVVVSQFWSTLNACSTPEIPPEEDLATEAVVKLPSQSQSLDEGDVGESLDALDGLVLVFVASQATPLVHCFDVTVRCNPPDTSENLEDLDGWRGYFAPITSPVTASDESTNLAASEGIIAMATCRSNTSNKGHRPLHVACISKDNVSVWEDPHLHLSCRLPLVSPRRTEATKYDFDSWNSSKDGNPSAVDLTPGIVAIGTNTGAVLVCTYGSSSNASSNNRGTGNSIDSRKKNLNLYLRIPPPPSPMSVVSVKISRGTPQHNEGRVSVFVAYRRSKDSQTGSAAGICCYDMPTPSPNSGAISAPSARHDLDGRHVASSGLCDSVSTEEGFFFTVARNDGLYTYSQTQKIGVAPIDGAKLSICVVPPPLQKSGARTYGSFGSNYTLVASTDSKSDRDAVDIYDSTNKLVAFHLLLSPGHQAIKSAGVSTAQARTADGRLRGGRSSSVVLTSGGFLISFTEKSTDDKVSLLVNKNMYSNAIAVAYSDAAVESSSPMISNLYRKYAEHLYRKGDYGASIEQYINTIGMLEPSHVCFRFLDAPKIQVRCVLVISLMMYIAFKKSLNLTYPEIRSLL